MRKNFLTIKFFEDQLCNHKPGTALRFFRIKMGCPFAKSLSRPFEWSSLCEDLILCPSEMFQFFQHLRSGIFELKPHVPLRHLPGLPFIDPGFEYLCAANAGECQFSVEEKKVQVDLIW